MDLADVGGDLYYYIGMEVVVGVDVEVIQTPLSTFHMDNHD
jgi:hypothetical protein